jgi:hypothetical protein
LFSIDFWEDSTVGLDFIAPKKQLTENGIKALLSLPTRCVEECRFHFMMDNLSIRLARQGRIKTPAAPTHHLAVDYLKRQNQILNNHFTLNQKSPPQVASLQCARFTVEQYFRESCQIAGCLKLILHQGEISKTSRC